jgi:putative oxidoreductase
VQLCVLINRKLAMPLEADGVNSVLTAAARSLIAAPFLFSAISKLMDWRAGLAEVRGLGLPLPAPVLVATVALQLGGGAMLVLGWHARWAAAALAAFTLMASLMAHPVWSTAGANARQQRVTFSEHLAIVGGLLMIVAHG